MMYTLDEVIKACEECLSHNEFCYQCIYNSDECLTDQKEEDCLYYLKEYKEMKEHLACMDNGEIRGDATQVMNNPPITWEELGKMEGKPVWINGVWYLITHTEDAYRDINPVINAIKANGVRCTFFPEDCNVIWQAYRKERK